MKGYIDLHLHSSRSDGDFTPKELVDKCISLGMKVIAITDHDTIKGLKEAEESAKGKIVFVPGVEISCCENSKGFPEIHVLGYFIDCNNKKLNNFLEKVRHERINQKKKTIDKLKGFGFDISFEEVNSLVKGEISRVHIAKAMRQKYPKEFETEGDVFRKYIDSGRPAYVKRNDETSVKKAVDIIKTAGGIAVLAHPGMYKDDDALELIEFFVQCGGEGLEVYYPYNKIYAKQSTTEEEEKRKIMFFKKIAKENDLIMTGGSDFHGGIRKSVQINEMKIPYSCFKEIKGVQT